MKSLPRPQLGGQTSNKKPAGRRRQQLFDGPRVAACCWSMKPCNYGVFPKGREGGVSLVWGLHTDEIGNHSSGSATTRDPRRGDELRSVAEIESIIGGC